MLFFADCGERAVVQGLLMGTVVSVLVTMLVLLQFLNHPFHAGIGGLRPEAMRGRSSSSTSSSRSRAIPTTCPATRRAMRSCAPILRTG